jgi:PKD repeat protein
MSASEMKNRLAGEPTAWRWRAGDEGDPANRGGGVARRSSCPGWGGRTVRWTLLALTAVAVATAACTQVGSVPSGGPVAPMSPATASVDLRHAAGGEGGPVSPIPSPGSRIGREVGKALLASCDRSLRPASTTLFNDPSGSAAAQQRILRYLVKVIDCTPPTNPDGGQASIHASFYSLTYAPVRDALIAAARRGVSVQVLASSHGDRFRAWQDLVEALGSDSSASSFAKTCWQGCLGPRQPPAPGEPTSWFSVRTESSDSFTAVFTDHSRPVFAPIVSWAWDFGDGTHAAGPGPHDKTYDAEGMYTTSLTVLDSAGASHRVSGTVTVPDSLEPMYPSLHSKLFLFSAVRMGERTQRWVSAFGSGNPTYAQARRGFNNLNVRVGDVTAYQAFDEYFRDLIAGSRGTLLTADYYRSVILPPDPAADTPRTVVHFMPQGSGNLQLDVLRSIQCRYILNGKQRHTLVRISMFAFTRVELAVELWRMAYERGCLVDLVYAQMNQRLRGADGTWLLGEAGTAMPWGPADCLATPPGGRIPTAPGAEQPATEVIGHLADPAGTCPDGALDGRVVGTKPGVWIDQKSPTNGGRLTVTASCPVEPYFDRLLQVWAFRCAGSTMFTHQKVLLVDGLVQGKRQKYVMTGSANWSESALRRNDEVVVELKDAPAIHDAYATAFKHQKRLFAAAGQTSNGRRRS